MAHVSSFTPLIVMAANWTARIVRPLDMPTGRVQVPEKDRTTQRGA